MTPMVHLLLLLFLSSIAVGKDLEEKKGPFQDTELDVAEGTPVPYALHQFQMAGARVDGFRLSGEGKDDIRISKDGWLFLEKPLDWSRDNHYILTVEALADDVVVGNSIVVTINVLDINNNAPIFNQSGYTATVREHNPAGVTFTQVFASDMDDPETPNAQLSYSLVSQIPNNHNILLFQIDPNTGEISTTEEGEEMLKAKEGIHYGRGEDGSIDALKGKFDEYCSVQKVPYEQNPFFTCVERAEQRRRNVDPLENPDYTLIVRVQDQRGTLEKPLSGNTRVSIAVRQNMWMNPGPITVQENLKGAYPRVIAKVRSNDPDAIYRLVQKERQLKFPFKITEDGEILLTEELDREEKDMYILVVFAMDAHDNEVDPPMEIQVLVEDVNDNGPVCEHEESVFELQEEEPVGSEVGHLLAHDNDMEGTLNSQLTYAIESQSSPTTQAFSIDDTGTIQALRLFRRKEQAVYNLNVRVSDSDFSTVCKVVIKIIGVNNELPLFEKKDYGSQTLAEDTPVGHTVVTIKATDGDEPGSGVSIIEFHISAGDDDERFIVETDGNGVGHLVVAKPLDFESSPMHNLKIDARNPEPLRKDLQYGSESTVTVSVTVTNVDEAPEFSLDMDMAVSVAEDATKGSVLLKVEAQDPEGKEIRFKLDGDAQGWLEIDASTGEIKTKNILDREKVESFDVTVIAFEKGNPEMSSERVVHVNLIDVNDNVPKLTETQSYICMKDMKPVIIKAEDKDGAPFSKPFTFSFANSKKSPNWELHKVDDESAELRLKKKPTQDRTFPLSINIVDNAGVGITQLFEVRVCNCTELGHCYTAPHGVGFKPEIGATVGILAGVLGFCLIAFIIVIKRTGKKSKSEEENAMM
ncbi:cadherin-17 [Cololabis saira]|uniref:cadherin-17 n=1 Tax=Cololabis saira TaxID=129043 RepID=UPI002AD36542|nr:cadherin-17 [Cololabis saira]